MLKVVIFGATDTGRRIYNDIFRDNEVIAFVDEDRRKWNTTVENIMVYNPKELLVLEYDYIYVGVLTYYQEVMSLLAKLNIPTSKIIDRYVSIPTYARIECLKNIKDLLDNENIVDGQVAELGVYQGDFAKEINRVFSKKKLYLFDTFEGFNVKDCKEEIDKGYLSANRAGYFSNTTEELVLGKMLYPDNCIICKGFFPDSARNIDEEFCFVNLDVDLYSPTLAGLEFFYPRLVNGGIIIIHDYFSKAFIGVKDAVTKFCQENNVKCMPIGDTLSVAIRK